MRTDFVKIADILLKNGAEISHTDIDGKTALHWAVSKSNLQNFH